MSVGSDVGEWTYRGRTPWSWVKRLLNPLNYFKLVLMIRAIWARRLLVIWIALLLQFRPGSVYRFSTQKVLPDKRFRLQKTLDPMDDFEIDRERTSELPQLDAVSLTLVGPTFDASLAEHLPGPIYAVNWPVKLDRQDVVYATTDYTILGAFLVNEMFPILFVEGNWIDAQGNYIVRDAGHWVEDYLDDPRINRLSLYRKGNTHANGGAPPTSGLAVMVALGFLANSIDVYGWDFYLDFTPAEDGYWKSLFNGFVNFEMESQPHHIEFTMYNWHYAYRFSQMPQFNIHGRMNGLEKHQGINDRLDKVFYKF